MLPEAKLIARLMTVFGEPRTDDPDAFLAEYRKALAGYAPDILEAAGDEIIKSAVYWPRPAEAVQTARRVAAERGAKQAIGSHVPRQATADPVPPRDADSRARMDALTRELGAFVAEHSLKPPKQVPLADASRPAFEVMQRNSPNAGLHQLTPRSRAMSGECGSLGVSSASAAKLPWSAAIIVGIARPAARRFGLREKKRLRPAAGRSTTSCE